MTASTHFDNGLRYRDGADLSHRQLTPLYVLEPVRAVLGGIGLDPCTEPDNPTGADRFYTAVDDGLANPWSAPDWSPSVFVNPPYGRAREPWVERCLAAAENGQRVVLLIPAHTDTRSWQRCLDGRTSVCFIRGRVKFGVLRENRRQEAASHPSCLFGWNVDLTPCDVLGRVVAVPTDPTTVRVAEVRRPIPGARDMTGVAVPTDHEDQP